MLNLFQHLINSMSYVTLNQVQGDVKAIATQSLDGGGRGWGWKSCPRMRWNNMKEAGMDCPGGHGKMVLRRAKKRMTFRGIKIIVPVEQYVCAALRWNFLKSEWHMMRP